ncbi:MAG: hypothetical protein C4523_01305 [Myxococcales bacterium]|nr:MAG: hypothetical protein C4523_01305 [Myxococcales bacterium]
MMASEFHRMFGGICSYEGRVALRGPDQHARDVLGQNPWLQEGPLVVSIGVTFVDLLWSLPELFSKEQADQIIELGSLNALFVVGRSIGLFGHIFDQKRLKQPLYRTAYDDICYLDDIDL